MTLCPKPPLRSMDNVDGLRPYQIGAVEYIHGLPPGSSAVIQSPTGSGKTRMLRASLRGKRAIVLTHRKILLEQLAAELTEAGMAFGFRAAGRRADLSAPIQIGMWQTEQARTFRKKQWPLHDCEYVHIDEPHAIKGDTMFGILNAYNMAGSTLVGWTATPANLAKVFKQKYVAATVKQLIDLGFLVPVQNYSPTPLDMERLERVKRDVNGEFSADALDKVYNQKVVFGKILENLNAINPTLKPTVLFAPGVPHSIWTAQTLTSAGIEAAHIDGKSIWYNGREMDSDSRNREMIFSLLRKGIIKVLCNRFVLREGWNEPCISHAILCPFGSLQSYIQAVGRILRPFEGKTLATVADHGGNTLRFPDIDTDIDWDMAEKEKEVTARHQKALREGTIPAPIVCPKCNANRTKGNTCPLCHHRTETETQTIIQVDGMLRVKDAAKPKTKAKAKDRSDNDVWRGLYFGNCKWYPHRTFRQIYTNWAKRNKFERWLPKNLPLMPRNPNDWHKAVNQVPIQDLY